MNKNPADISDVEDVGVYSINSIKFQSCCRPNFAMVFAMVNLRFAMVIWRFSVCYDVKKSGI